MSEYRGVRSFGKVLSAVLLIIGAVVTFAPWSSIATEGLRTIDMTSHLIILALFSAGSVMLMAGALLLFAKKEETKVALGVIGVLPGLFLTVLSLTFNGYAYDELYLVQRIRSLLPVLGTITSLVSFGVAATSWRKGTLKTG